MATLKQNNNHICNCEFCKNRTPCLICGTFDDLHRCHIIPQRIIYRIIENTPEREEWLDFKGKNVIIMCERHHRDFDCFKLKEIDILKPYVMNTIEEFIKFTEGKSISEKGKRILDIWVDKNNKWLFGGGKVISFEYEPI